MYLTTIGAWQTGQGTSTEPTKISVAKVTAD